LAIRMMSTTWETSLGLRGIDSTARRITSSCRASSRSSAWRTPRALRVSVVRTPRGTCHFDRYRT
jgi:hypothetical protein